MTVTDIVKGMAGLPLIANRLAKIEIQLSRLADMKELELAAVGLYVKPPVVDKSGEEPDVIYTDEVMDLAREVADVASRKVGGDDSQP